MEEKKNDFLVVEQLPQVSATQYEQEEKTYDLITRDEAIKEILENTRKILKSVG